jgi:hypothetical protein
VTVSFSRKALLHGVSCHIDWQGSIWERLFYFITRNGLRNFVLEKLERVRFRASGLKPQPWHKPTLRLSDFIEKETTEVPVKQDLPLILKFLSYVCSNPGGLGNQTPVVTQHWTLSVSVTWTQCFSWMEHEYARKVKLSLCFNRARHEGVLGVWRYGPTHSWPRH